ncbi:GATA transcription factor 29 [Hirschfeldia incana]|nr:GATA transcription factor 29 [Hirschfeldia incana]
MEKELDLTLRLGLPSPAIETHLSLHTPPTTNQKINIDGGRNDGGETHGRRHILRNEDESIDANMRYYNLVFDHFAGIGETLNFAPFPIQSSSPVPATPTRSDYVLIDVPARRAVRNSSATGNSLDANANQKKRRGCGGCCGGRIGWLRKCTNRNCNATDTPMWRRGPLGPKTLCNACGIKFRKEEERRSKST